MSLPRSAGILLHPTSLPGSHGVGDFGDDAYTFADFLHRADMGVWQILPLGPPGAAHSPYQTLSSFAGNALLISLERLAADGLLVSKDLPAGGGQTGPADYAHARTVKQRVLRLAHRRFAAGEGDKRFRRSLEQFRTDAKDWLAPFALYMALREHYAGRPWYDWPDASLVQHEPRALERAQREHADAIEFHVFCQHIFFRQWRALKTHANERGIRIMGDVPIYVALDSADVWADRRFFRVDTRGTPTHVAGVPPDYFSPTGQLWGNPLYRWDRLATDGYAWWIRRIRRTLASVDILRIDHFRGFEAFWEIDAAHKNAKNGRWVKGPGADFFRALERALGSLPLVAEDLGIITPEVEALRREFGFPGMKVLQFAFAEGAESYLPHTYEPNCVAYTATHDNDTTQGWYRAEGPDYAHMDREGLARERDKARRYLARDGTDIHTDFVRLALASVADTAIVPMQDVLGLGNDARMNRPGQSDGQWTWRLAPGALASAPADRLREMVWLYGRESSAAGS